MNDPTTNSTTSDDLVHPEIRSAPSRTHGSIRLPPVHVRIPYIRHDETSKGDKGHATSFPNPPTFDGVDAVLRQPVADTPKSYHPRSIKTRHPAHRSRSATSSAPTAGPSWRSVVLLILILLAAAGMTFWITHGAMQTAPDSSIKTPPWDTSPPTVAGNPFPKDESQTFPLSIGGRPDDPEIFPANPSAVQSSDNPDTTYSVGGSKRRNFTPGVTMQSGASDGEQDPSHWDQPRLAQFPVPSGPHQVTNSPDRWEIPLGSETDSESIESTNTLPAATPEPDATYPATAPVSFKGHIETPNLRARYDRQRSILH
ncbi:MAG: hypothetical protein JW829_21050 [Pirellulales bacterium]|nr:hypothetical protein [Pirellulales bacterium]